MEDSDFRALFEGAPGRFLALRPDAGFTIIAASDAYLRATATVREQLIGRGICEAIAGNANEDAALLASLARVMARRVTDAMAVHKSDDGGSAERCWHPVNSPVLSPAGEVLYIIHRLEHASGIEHDRGQAPQRQGDAADNHELATTNSQLRSANERGAIELEQATRALEAFSYSIAHDLRAPLRAIDGFSKALLDEYFDQLDAQAHHYLTWIRESTKRTSLLIDALLSLSRITRAPLSPQPVALSEMAQSVVAELRRRDPARPGVVEIAAGMRAQGDPKLLGLVLQNLIGNAWKFTARQPHPRITVGCTTDAGQPAFFVSDNGAGFDMAFADKLFAPFQRLHKATDFEGTGIGLATAQRVIARHGGRIWVHAEVDQGATFYFTLGEQT